MTTRVSADDRFAVQDLLMAYVYASDTGNADAYAATFAPDGVLVTSDGERIVGHSAIRDHARHAFAAPGTRGRMHFFQQIRIAPEARGFRVLSFWQVVQVNGATRTGRVRSTGTCDDLCIRIGEDFRFAERTIGRWTDETAPWFA
jgi:uncharacterized protein (TIGR02246 family)